MPKEKTINLKNSEHKGAPAETIPAEQKVNNMITFKHGKNWFTFRAAALILNPGRRLVLLHKNETDPFWSLPGGRGEFFEPSAETVVREIMEEIGIGASVERLAFVIENFFKYGCCDCHELGFYYLVRPEGPGTWIYEAPCFEGREGDEKLYFKWFELSELDAVELYPRCLRARLKNIPDTLEHIVHSD